MFYSNAIACTCVGESTVEGEYESSDLVVTARVIAVDKVFIWSDTTLASKQYDANKDSISRSEKRKYLEQAYSIQLLEYSVVVQTAYKGAKANDTLQIRTGMGHGDCGFPFIINKDYLIYAQHEHTINYSQKKPNGSRKDLQGIFRTNICRRTALLKESYDDIKYLDNK